MVARIMVVDDLPLMRMRIRESLLVEGHEVVEATEGGDAMEQYRRKRPDAVFMDVRMPDMNGVDALKQMREIDPTARVTLLTGDAQREIVEEAKTDGREEGERMITLAQAEMEQQLHQAREQLRGEVVTLALAGASQVLEREVDAKAHSASLDKLAAEL